METPDEIKEIPVNSSNINSTINSVAGLSTGITPKAVGYFSQWDYSNIYYASFYIGSDHYQCYSLPYGDWRASNASDTTIWTNTFKIAEHVSVNGVIDRSLDNPFRYKNVKLATSVGGRSTITTAMIDGTLSDESHGSSFAMLVAEKVWSKLIPIAPSLDTIQSWIDAIIDIGSSKDITLGSSNIMLSTSPTVTESVSSGSHQMYRLTSLNGSNTGHYLVLQTTVQYEGPNGGFATTNGAMEIKWDIYYATNIHNNGK